MKSQKSQKSQSHVSEKFENLAISTSIAKCGKNEAKISFQVNDKILTSYIRKSRDSYIIQVPFKTDKIFENDNHFQEFKSHETSKQVVYRFESPEDLMIEVEKSYENHIS